MLIERRRFIAGAIALLAAPTIVRAASLMPVRRGERFLLPRRERVIRLEFYDTRSDAWVDLGPVTPGVTQEFSLPVPVVLGPNENVKFMFRGDRLPGKVT